MDKSLFFEASDSLVIAVDSTGQRHFLTQATLKKVETLLDPLQIFRINRSELVNKKYVERLERYSKNSVAIRIQGIGKQLITSQSTTSAFRALDQFIQFEMVEGSLCINHTPLSHILITVPDNLTVPSIIPTVRPYL